MQKSNSLNPSGLIYEKKINNKTSKVKFKPFNNYGRVFKGIDWHKITYDINKGSRELHTEIKT